MDAVTLEWVDFDTISEQRNMRDTQIFKEKLSTHYPDLYDYFNSDRHFSSIRSFGEELGIRRSHNLAGQTEAWGAYCGRIWKHIQYNEELHAMWLL